MEQIITPKQKYDVYPWRRYFARYVDCIFWAIILLITPLSAFDKIDDKVSGIFLLASWIPVEALFISCFGATPGKLIGKIRVVDSNGRKLSFWRALKRGGAVFIFGLGLGLPIVNLITMAIQHDKLKKNGATNYDINGGYQVIVGKTNIFRVLVNPFLLFLVMLVLAVGAIYASSAPKINELVTQEETAMTAHLKTMRELKLDNSKLADQQYISQELKLYAETKGFAEDTRRELFKVMAESDQLGNTNLLVNLTKVDAATRQYQREQLSGYFDKVGAFITARTAMLQFLQDNQGKYTVQNGNVSFGDKALNDKFTQITQDVDSKKLMVKRALVSLDEAFNK